MEEFSLAEALMALIKNFIRNYGIASNVVLHIVYCNLQPRKPENPKVLSLHVSQNLFGISMDIQNG